MKVFTITNMWPIPQNKYFGIFVKEQVESLNYYHPEIINRIWFIKGYKSKFNYFISIFSINFHLLCHSYDLIHLHYGLSGMFLLLNIFHKAPIVTMFHGSDINITTSGRLIFLLSKYVAKRSNKVLILNEKMFGILTNVKEKLVYLPCGVDDLFFVPTDNLNNAEMGKIKIAFPASKDRPEKNWDFFESIVIEMKNQGYLNIEVIEIHNKSRSEVLKILNEIDLLVMTSISEGSPQIIKEAMCCNTPIVSSNVGDVKHLLDGVKNSYVIDGYNVNEYIKQILKILNIPKSERVSDGRDRIYKLGLDNKTTASKLKAIYASLNSNHSKSKFH